MLTKNIGNPQITREFWKRLQVEIRLNVVKNNIYPVYSTTK